MFGLFFSLILIATAVFFKKIPLPVRVPAFAVTVGRVVVGVFAVYLLASTSFVVVPQNHFAQLYKVYGGSSLENGKLVAVNGEKGPQADIIMPGFHVMPLVSIFNNVQIYPMVDIPAGYYGRLETKDGEPLPPNAIMAAEWPESEASNYLDATYFLTHHGQKGVQLSFLKPGRYAINTYLYTVRVGFRPDDKNGIDWVWDETLVGADGPREEKSPFVTYVTHIKAGEVGVVRSNVSKPGIDCTAIKAATAENAIAVDVVPQGCRGIWKDALTPGDYFLNHDAYTVTMVDTRLQTLEYRGGYTKRFIDLSVDQSGTITQQPRSEEVKQTEKDTDHAVMTKVEGWDVPQEVRAQLQVDAEHAPIVVASIGGLFEVEQKVITPAIRSVVRDVIGSKITVTEKDAKGNDVQVVRPTRALDLQENRAAIQESIDAELAPIIARAGVEFKGIQLGDSAIPPELLVAARRQYLAGQLKSSYDQENIAQTARQAVEASKALADKQGSLVEAQIGVQKSELAKTEKKNNGEAERLYQEAIAKGQEAQANVLGKEKVLQLAIVDRIVSALKERPELITGIQLPRVYVSGGNGNGGLESAILGMLAGNTGSSAATPNKTPLTVER